MSKQAIIEAISGVLDYAASEGIEEACNDSTFHDFADGLDLDDLEGLKVDAQDMVNELIKSPEFLEMLKTNVGSIMSELRYALAEKHGIVEDSE